MRNTWWLTRPKRDLSLVPLTITAMANVAEGERWQGTASPVGLAVEAALRHEGLKGGNPRTKNDSGARTYRAWMRGLGLAFLDEERRFQLTLAGSALVQGEPPLPILKNQVLKFQLPSAVSTTGQSAVSPDFRVRPAVFILQLLADHRLDGYVTQNDDIAKIACCYGVSNSQECVDDVVTRILAYRQDGTASLEPDYVQRFGGTSRTRDPDAKTVFANLIDIANTFGNWLGYTQLITREPGTGRWEITSGAEPEVREVIAKATKTPLITKPEDEENFQRRYGLTPGKRKDTRRLGAGRTVTSATVQEREINAAFMRAASAQIITRISPEIVETISNETGYPKPTVERALSKTYRAGAVGTFIHSYAQMAFESREKATDFEKATAEIFRDIFQFQAEHIGQRGRVPDVVIASESEGYGALLDSKAYAKGYSLGISQQNRMRDYIDDYQSYALTGDPLAFFTYVVADYKTTINAQVKEVAETNGVPGSVITARDIIRMVERHRTNPYTHAQIKDMLSLNRALTYEDLALAS